MELPFNGYEQAIFTDVYMGLRGKPYVAWYKDIGKLSRILRNYAVMRGIEIDDRFRSVSNLSVRAREMQYLDSAGAMGMSGGPVWMREMLDWYKCDLGGFKRFLEDANRQMGIAQEEHEVTPEAPRAEPPKVMETVEVVEKPLVEKNECAAGGDYCLDEYETALLVELCSRSYKYQEMKDLSCHMQKYVEGRHILDREGLRTVYALNKRTSYIYRLLSKGKGEKRGTLPMERKIARLYLENTEEFRRLLDEAYDRLKMEKCGLREAEVAIATSAATVENKSKTDYDHAPQRPLENIGEPKRQQFTEEQLRCQQVLADFPNGISVASLLDQDRFAARYEKLYGKSPVNLFRILETVGTKRGDRIFPAVSGETKELLHKVKEEIKRVFDEGYSCVYFEAVMDRYRDELGKQEVYTVDELKELLKPGVGDGYEINGQRMIKWGTRADLKSDALHYLRGCGAPTGIDTIEHDMWQIPIKTLRQQAINTCDAIINTDTNMFMAAESFPLSQADLGKIRDILKVALSSSPEGKLRDEACRKLIWEKLPSVEADTRNYSLKAFHSTLKYWLTGIGRDFVIEGHYIAFSYSNLQSGAETVEKFCRDRDRFDMEELQSFAKENNITLLGYQEVVRKNSLRLSKEEFCGLDQVKFDVPAVDKMLEFYCPDAYAPLGTVKNYLHLPTPEGAYWSEYLLESYVNCISEKFHLMHARFNDTDIVGAMVRKESGFSDYDEVMADVLAKNKAWSNKEEALEYLVTEGYLARNRYAKIDKVIKRAEAIRREPIDKGEIGKSSENRQEILENPSLPRQQKTRGVESNANDSKMKKKKKKSGANAVGIVSEHGFTVKKGSSISAESKSSNKVYNRLRKSLESSGVINYGIFQRDYEFSSPSAAGSVVTGRASNGRIDWESADGIPFRHFGIKVQRGEVFYEHPIAKKKPY